MTHLHTKFCMPNYDGSFVITIKLKAYAPSTILSSHIQQKITLT
jgi:hypothetical protein